MNNNSFSGYNGVSLSPKQISTSPKLSGSNTIFGNTLSHSGTTFSPTTENRIEIEIRKRTSQHLEKEQKLNSELEDLRSECNGLKKNLDDALGKMLDNSHSHHHTHVNHLNYGLSVGSRHGSPTLSHQQNFGISNNLSVLGTSLSRARSPEMHQIQHQSGSNTSGPLTVQQQQQH